MLIPPSLAALHAAVMEELDIQASGRIDLFSELIAPSITRLLSCVAQVVDGSKIMYGGHAQALPMLLRGDLGRFREDFYPKWHARVRRNHLLITTSFSLSDELAREDAELTTEHLNTLKVKELDELINPEFSGEIHLTQEAPWVLVYGGASYNTAVGASIDPLARIIKYMKLLPSITKDFQQSLDVVQEEMWETFWIARSRYKTAPAASTALPTKKYSFVF